MVHNSIEYTHFKCNDFAKKERASNWRDIYGIIHTHTHFVRSVNVANFYFLVSVDLSVSLIIR